MSVIACSMNLDRLSAICKSGECRRRPTCCRFDPQRIGRSALEDQAHGFRGLANSGLDRFLHSSRVVLRVGLPSPVSLRDICDRQRKKLLRETCGVIGPSLMSLPSRTVEDKALARVSSAWVAFLKLRITLSSFQREPLITTPKHSRTRPTLIFFDRHQRQAILIRMCEDSPVGAIRLPGVLGGAVKILAGSIM